MTQERNTERREGSSFAYEMAAGASVFLGQLVVLVAGYAKAGLEDAGAVAVGIAKASVDNAGGVDGGQKVIAETGTWKLDNAAGADAITRADIGQPCFVLDATTVAKTDGGGTRGKAGIVRAIEPNGVWVTI